MASWGKTDQTDKDMRENKDYTHRHTNEGIRNRWEKGQVRERKGNMDIFKIKQETSEQKINKLGS